MKGNLFRLVSLCMAGLVVSGCGHRYMTPRAENPLIEDRVRMGSGQAKKMSALTSRADRRTILVFGENEVCAEPPPDVAEAVFSEFAAKISKEGKAEAEVGSTLQTALLQLSRRSQGLDYFRTGSFVYCMMYYNGAFGAGETAKAEYISKMQQLMVISEKLTLAEIEKLPAIATAVTQVSREAEKASK